jgi:hypothetical protein
MELFQMLADCLMDCYNSSKAAGTPLALEVFISGRGRLENEGSTALSEVFKVIAQILELFVSGGDMIECILLSHYVLALWILLVTKTDYFIAM